MAIAGSRPSGYNVIKMTEATLYNVANWYDLSETSEGYVNVQADNNDKNARIELKGFDFSAVPAGSTVSGARLVFRAHVLDEARRVSLRAGLDPNHLYAWNVGYTNYTWLSIEFHNWFYTDIASYHSPDLKVIVAFDNKSETQTSRLYISDMFLYITYSEPVEPANGSLAVVDNEDVIQASGTLRIAGSLSIVDGEDVVEGLLDSPDLMAGKIIVVDEEDIISASGVISLKGRVDVLDGEDVVSCGGAVALVGSMSVVDEEDIIEISTLDVRAGPVYNLSAIRSADKKKTTLTWSAAQHGSAYHIMRSDDMRGSSGFELLASVTGLTYVDNHNDSHKNFTYYVYATSPSGKRGMGSPFVYTPGLEYDTRTTI